MNLDKKIIDKILANQKYDIKQNRKELHTVINGGLFQVCV